MSQAAQQYPLSTPASQSPLSTLHAPPLRVAIAEDDDDIRLGLAGLFARDGYEVSCVANGELLVDHLERCRRKKRLPDAIILDHRMPGYCGLEILEGIQQLEWRTPVILITAFGREVSEPARLLGASAIFEKPFDPDDLRTAVSYWVGSHQRPYPLRAVHGAMEAPTCITCGSTTEVCAHEALGVFVCRTCWDGGHAA